MSASLNKAATTHGYHTLPHPLLNGVPQRRMRLTVETDASWVSVTSDQHDGPGFSLTVHCDGTATLGEPRPTSGEGQFGPRKLRLGLERRIIT